MNKIKISGINYYREDFTGEDMPAFFGTSDFHKQIYLFLKEWFSDEENVKLYTSGSTGKPKEIIVRKKHMLESASMTCKFFGLNESDKALLCLSVDYIAGKMMLVRAIYSGMDIYPVEPKGHPLKETSSSFDFAAMVPLQVYNSLQIEDERMKLSKIRNLIIGGGAINIELEKALRPFPNSVYSTYGMTETVSHIALRKINGEDASDYYTPLSGVSLKFSDNKTLIIDAPDITEDTIITNDIAEIRDDGTFRITGRIDNIINTGGIKVQAEEVEEILKPFIKGNYAITSIPHTKLGEAIVLLVDNTENQQQSDKIIKNSVPRYKQPMYIIKVKDIPLTGSGKIDRAAVKKIAILMTLTSPK
ncbi:MAG: AMP-binding protein [Fermentimonas sp.]|nr:AMP-binding protein [Fermentimonas sp.]